MLALIIGKSKPRTRSGQRLNPEHSRRHLHGVRPDVRPNGDGHRGKRRGGTIRADRITPGSLRSHRARDGQRAEANTDQDGGASRGGGARNPFATRARERARLPSQRHCEQHGADLRSDRDQASSNAGRHPAPAVGCAASVSRGVCRLTGPIGEFPPPPGRNLFAAPPGRRSRRLDEHFRGPKKNEVPYIRGQPIRLH